MILLCSKQQDDATTRLIEWLVFWKIPFVRISNLKSVIVSWNSQFSPNASFEINGISFCLDKIKSLYCGGGKILMNNWQLSDVDLAKEVSDNQRKEIKDFFTYSLSKLNVEKCFGIPFYLDRKINKLDALEKANALKMHTPETAIVSTKLELLRYLKIWNRMITKSIEEGYSIRTENIYISGQRTEEVTLDVIEKMGDTFFPSLIQKLIEKKFEIRVVFFNGKFYSIAIYPLSNFKDSVDFRSKWQENTHRYIPYKISIEMEGKILKLMEQLGLNYGSIDLILGEDNLMYFLEVNPYGQYGFVSIAGNYYIEKDISIHLS